MLVLKRLKKKQKKNNTKNNKQTKNNNPNFKVQPALLDIIPVIVKYSLQIYILSKIVLYNIQIN